MLRPWLYLFFSFALMGTASCSLNAVGFVGSSMWLDTAPQEEVDNYMRKKSLVKLSRMWNSAEFSNEREAVARELGLRGLDPLMFYDPTADQVRAIKKRLDRIERDASQTNSIICLHNPGLRGC